MTAEPSAALVQVEMEHLMGSLQRMLRTTITIQCRPDDAAAWQPRWVVYGGPNTYEPGIPYAEGDTPLDALINLFASVTKAAAGG